MTMGLPILRHCLKAILDDDIKKNQNKLNRRPTERCYRCTKCRPHLFSHAMPFSRTVLFSARQVQQGLHFHSHRNVIIICDFLAVVGGHHRSELSFRPFPAESIRFWNAFKRGEQKCHKNSSSCCRSFIVLFFPEPVTTVRKLTLTSCQPITKYHHIK